MYIWGDDRRFNSYNSYFTREFGGRVQKISIDAGFSCPNRDGTISTGGCTFCRNDAFNPSYCRPEKSIRQQIEEGMEFHQRRYRRAKSYLAYFQPYTNTHKPVGELERLYREALSVDGVIGIVIGSRLSKKQETINRRNSKTRVRVEHVFGYCELNLHGMFSRVIGFARNAARNTLTNLVYNVCRYEQIVRLGMN